MFFSQGGRGKWVGVAEHTLAHPHVKFEHDTTFHRLIFNEIFKKNSGDQFVCTYCSSLTCDFDGWTFKNEMYYS